MSELIAENDIIDKGTVSGFKRQLFQFMQSLTTTQNIKINLMLLCGMTPVC